MTKNQQSTDEKKLESGHMGKLGELEPKGGKNSANRHSQKMVQRGKTHSSPLSLRHLPSKPKSALGWREGHGMAHGLVLRLSVIMRPARAWGSNPEKSWLKNRG